MFLCFVFSFFLFVRDWDTNFVLRVQLYWNESEFFV